MNIYGPSKRTYFLDSPLLRLCAYWQLDNAVLSLKYLKKAADSAECIIVLMFDLIASFL